MKKPLLDVVFSSEKRKTTLLTLQDGPCEMENLLRYLNTTRQALLPQIKILEKSYLIEHIKNDSYKLSATGKLIVDRMIPLMDTLDVFDANIDYWGSRNLDFIHPYLFDRLHELTPCEVISSTPSVKMYDPSETAIEKAKLSRIQNSVTTFLFPNFASILSDFNEHGVKMRLIVSEDLLYKIRSEKNDVRKLLDSDIHEVFLYPEKMHFMSFGTNDFCFMMRMLTKTGDYDQKYIIACNPSAIQWSNELFNHYLKKSTKIDSI